VGFGNSQIQSRGRAQAKLLTLFFCIAFKGGGDFEPLTDLTRWTQPRIPNYDEYLGYFRSIYELKSWLAGS
jgi:hypothetical protein